MAEPPEPHNDQILQFSIFLYLLCQHRGAGEMEIYGVAIGYRL